MLLCSKLLKDVIEGLCLHCQRDVILLERGVLDWHIWGTVHILFISDCGLSVFQIGGVAGGGGAHDACAAKEYDVLLRLVDSCGTAEKSGTCCDEL
jgi:hypothetical protein